MATIVAAGWMKSPTGVWHHGTVFDSTFGVVTDCGVRADREAWWLDVFDPLTERPEGIRLCQRCWRYLKLEAG